MKLLEREVYLPKESSFNSGFNDNAMIGFRALLAKFGQIDDVRIYDRALSP